jgi:hypothetical protein
MKKHSFFIACSLAVWGLLPVAANAAANPKTSPATVSKWGVDDWNTSTLIPNTVDANGNNTPTLFNGPCQWITTAMNTFIGTNANYKYQWANAAFANLKGDLTVTDYKPWVVNPINLVNGFNLMPRTSGDKGGATFGLTYTPKAGDPTSVLFIQAYQEILYPGPGNGGATINVNLDNSGGAPQYGGASSYAAASSKMADRPFDSEPEAQEGYHTDVEFQTAIATYATAAGVTTLTIYPLEEWWGYQYSNTDVPEPSTCLAGALMLLPFGTRALRRLRASRKTE